MTETRHSIWCLLSVEVEYDHPDNNLVRYWTTKPTLEVLAKFMACPLASAKDEDIVKLVSLWKGEPEQFFYSSTTYRLQEVFEGESL